MILATKQRTKKHIMNPEINPHLQNQWTLSNVPRMQHGEKIVPSINSAN